MHCDSSSSYNLEILQILQPSCDKHISDAPGLFHGLSAYTMADIRGHFPPDCSSHDQLFRCISCISTFGDIGFSHRKAHPGASHALRHFYCLPSVSSQTHHYTGQGAGRRRVRCHRTLRHGRTDVGLCISALEEIWRQAFGRMRVKSLEICHVFSVSSEVCLLLALR